MTGSGVAMEMISSWLVVAPTSSAVTRGMMVSGGKAATMSWTVGQERIFFPEGTVPMS